MTYTDLQPLHSLTRSASQPIKPYDAELDGSKHNVERGTFFRKSHCRRGSEPLVPQFLKSFKFDFDVDGKNIQPQKPPKTKTFPMGCCLTTSHNNGWLDIGCGPEITIEITYRGHNSDMRHVSSGGAMNPSQMFVDINAPQVLLRVFGTLARDLLSLKVFLCMFSSHCISVTGKLSRRVYVLQNIFVAKFYIARVFVGKEGY